MFESPPSGRALTRAPQSCVAANPRGGNRLPLMVALTLMVALLATLFAGVTPAAAKKRKDTSSPFVIKAVTVDSNGNGRVDGIRLTYSENIRIAKIKKGKGKAKKKDRNKLPWQFTGGHKFSSATVLADGKTVLVSVSEGSSVDTSERPTIAYFPLPKGARGVTDRAGNQALMASLKAVDGVAPRLVSAVTKDGDSNGRVDAITFTFSEPVVSPDVSRFSVAGYVVTGVTASGTTATATVAEQGVDTQATPSVTATAAAVKDAAGNDQADDESVTAGDGAPPAVIDAVTSDANSNGRIDGIHVRFSEPITHAAEAGAGAVTGVGFTTTAVSAATNDSLDVTLADSSGGYSTAVKPVVGTAATASPVADLSGNQAGSSTFTGTRDGAPPILVSAKTKDANANGFLDGVATVFSEPITFVAGASSYFSSTTTVLGTFGAAATASGSTVTAPLVEDTVDGYNTDLPRSSPSVPVPITYVPPGSGGAIDAAGNQAAAKTVQATDGAGPAIVYAETVDNNPADGHIDGVNVGFSEPISTLVGDPFSIAGGSRIVIDDPNVPTDGEKIISGGAPGDPLYKGVTVPLYPLTTNGKYNGPLADPDTADKPTVDYATAISGSVRTAYAEDASHNEVVATGTQSFTNTTDKVPPVLLSMQVDDSSADGYVDRMRTVWSEAVATNGSPSFAALSPQNAPLSGYTPPVPVPGASTAAGFTVTTPMTPGSNADRDITFRSQYVPSGPGDTGVHDVAGNNAATTPALPLSLAPSCTDLQESTSAGQDDTSVYADASGLATPDTSHLATLCGGDSDNYSFSATSGDPVSILLAPSPEALVARTGNAYNPFTVTAPGGGAVSLSSLTWSDTTGWIGRFTAATTGTYKVGVRDTLSPLLDYGYCISRTNDGTDPTCSVHQGDIIVTEVLRDVDANPPSVGPYVEFKNVSSRSITVDSSFQLITAGTPCTLVAYPGTNTTIAAGGSFYVSNTEDSSLTNDFGCAGMNIQFSSPIELRTTAGTIDSVDLSNVNPPPAFSVQLRGISQWESSSANDDIAGGWCLSSRPYGTWGGNNSNCDEYRINEAGFLPSSSDRDGQVYVELQGNGSLTPASTLLAGWRIRVKPQGMAGAFFVLPSNANPNSSGLFVLADSPASGSTQVPLYSVESAGLTAGDTNNGGAVNGRTLDQYLRADRPVTVKLLKPASGDPLVCTGPSVDTLGFSPTAIGTLGPADSDGPCGAAYATHPFAYPQAGYNAGDSVQRDTGRVFQDDNNHDFCAEIATPLSQNYTCFAVN